MLKPFDALRPQIDRTQLIALVVGVVGLIACAAGAFIDPTQFFQSYLFAFLFWFGLSIGSMAVVMLHHMVSGSWAAMIRRLLENSMMLIPLMGLLFIPVLLGIPDLYVWARDDVVRSNPIIAHKALYLNVPFFIGRTIFYFVVWSLMAYFLNRWSNEEDRNPSSAITKKFQKLSAPGLLIYGITMTFAAFDWGMSLDPEWYSSIYGVIYIIGQALSGLTLAILLVSAFRKYQPLAGVFTVNRLHDISKLLFAFVVLWTYIGFSQLLIIYSGNIAEETPWYITRSTGGWQYFAIFLVAFQFVTPFFILLSRRTRRTIGRMVVISVALLFVRLVDLFWLITPTFHQEGVHFHWLDVMAPIGIGGIWIAAYLYMLKRRNIVAINAPALQAPEAHAPEAIATSH